MEKLLCIFNLFIFLTYCGEYAAAQVNLYGQCGGNWYVGPNVCAQGLSCYKFNDGYSQCLTSCDPVYQAGWDCLKTEINNPVKNTPVALYGQCGGSWYFGSTVCESGLTCYKMNDAYSQCLSHCDPYYQAGWDCLNAIPTSASTTQAPTNSILTTQTVSGLPLYTTCSKQKTVALTLDDGPSSQTLQILNVLRLHNVKAIFFVLGVNSWDASTLKQIVSEGHLIGSHTWSHTNVLTLDNSKILQELKDTENAIRQATGSIPQYFRPPYGAISDEKGTFIRSLGYKIINWNVDSADWDSGASAQSIFENVKNGIQLSNGGIILMHDIYKATHESLSSIISHLKSESYNIVRLDECI